MSNKILMIGNLPNHDPRSIGGANTYTSLLFRLLKRNESLDVCFLHIRKKWYKYGQIFDFIILPFKVINRISKYDVVSIHASWDFHITVGPIIVLICKAYRKKIIYHFFGGKFHELYKSYPWLLKKWLDITILKSDIKLMETKRMISFFKNKNMLGFVWFPNSRQPNIIGSKSVNKKFCKRFVFISRVTPSKGVDILIKVKKELPPDYTLDLFGPIDESHYSIDFFEKQGVNYLGILNPSQVIKTLSKYDILVLPTFYKGEGYPGIFIEAMSIGIPIISTNWNSLDELVINNETGKLVSVKDVESLKKAILFFNEKNYESYSKKALEKFNDFNVLNIIEKLIKLYNKND